jgi:hypothetical protein
MSEAANTPVPEESPRAMGGNGRTEPLTESTTISESDDCEKNCSIERILSEQKIKQWHGLQSDLRRMLRYAASIKDHEAPDGLIPQVVQILETPPDTLTLKNKQDAWELLDQLTAEIHPVTAETLRVAEQLTNDQIKRPGFIRIFWKDTLPRAAVRSSVLSLVFWLITTLLVQIYAVLGGAYIKDIDNIRKELETPQLSNISPSLSTITPTVSTSSSTAITLRVQTLNSQLMADDFALFNWNCVWRFPIGIFTGKNDCSDATFLPNPWRDETTARRVLEVLNYYLLPMLYGLFGAAAFVLRSLSSEIDQTTFEAKAILGYRLRRALGAALGIAVGLFYTPEAHLQLSLIAVAFLAGYNVEVFLVIFDGIVSHLQRWLGGESNKQTG